MDFKSSYMLWSTNASDDSDLIDELKSIADNENEIYERFYKELEFGTAGLRGVIGAGTNRMNIYTVRRTTQGLANFLKKKYEAPTVAITYDSRIKADLFAKEAARVLAANGVKAYITTELQPTPLLSFAVRELKCQAGIMVTASHNPAKYNGYKCYGHDGCQMTDNNANAVYQEIQNVDYFNGDIKLADFDASLENGSIKWIKDSLYETYLDNVQKQTVHSGICKDSGLNIVYTPLNGAGNKLVRKILSRIGVKNVILVPEQEMPDGNFTTCPYPNPEIKEALALGLDLCKKTGADLLLATDPDSDRVGIAVKTADGYRLMSGNETGVMLMNYILGERKALGTLPERPVAVKTIVTSKLVECICKKYNCELRNVLTGFKYIGEQILSLEEKGEQDRYVFGFEESYGYLAGTYVRDKDAVVASMLICEMAAYYRTQGKSLAQVMDEIYKENGYYINVTNSYTFEGASGMEKMKSIMSSLRENTPNAIADYKVTETADYLLSVTKNLTENTESEINLPKSNVLSYVLEGDNAVIVRPSGTEPKIKVYITSVGQTTDDAVANSVILAKAAENVLGI